MENANDVKMDGREITVIKEHALVYMSVMAMGGIINFNIDAWKPILVEVVNVIMVGLVNIVQFHAHYDVFAKKEAYNYLT